MTELHPEQIPGAPPLGDSASDPPTQLDALRAEINGLTKLGIDGLRLRWRLEMRRSAPAHLPKFLLLRILAYRIQAKVLGDLDLETLRTLNRFARKGKLASSASSAARRGKPRRVLKPGTILVREWDGHLHRVEVQSDGFAWNNEIYKSLSTVAKAITGTQWSGPRFFGLLRRDKSRPTPEEATSRGDSP